MLFFMNPFPCWIPWFYSKAVYNGAPLWSKPTARCEAPGQDGVPGPDTATGVSEQKPVAPVLKRPRVSGVHGAESIRHPLVVFAGGVRKSGSNTHLEGHLFLHGASYCCSCLDPTLFFVAQRASLMVNQSSWCRDFLGADPPPAPLSMIELGTSL